MFPMQGQLYQAYSALGRIFNINLDGSKSTNRWQLKNLKVNTYIFTSFARRASGTTRTSRPLRKWETQHFTNNIFINI